MKPVTPVTPDAPLDAKVEDAAQEVAQRARWTPALLIGGWLALVLAGTALAFFASSLVVLPGDLAIGRAVQQARRTDFIMSPLMHAVSTPGAEPWVIVIYGLAVAAFAALRRWAATILMALTATADAMAGAVKLAVGRARPTEDLVRVLQHPTDFSFPSGHTVHYVVFFGALIYLCARTLRRRDTGAATHILAATVLGVSAVLIALVGLSRVYLGAHWPSDVAGGYVLGGAWLAMLIAAHRKWVEPRWLRIARAEDAAPAAVRVSHPAGTARTARAA
ncbi:MAG TPA: phosphatase PAP2 family protein [Chloroflexota bacterium]|nr:phosphatase PAP2 family protein [Chloroflexota bacterium]